MMVMAGLVPTQESKTPAGCHPCLNVLGPDPVVSREGRGVKADLTTSNHPAINVMLPNANPDGYPRVPPEENAEFLP